MHFDVAIQNPPYDRNLHLKVLEQVLKVADKVINISPVRWLQDPFAPYSSKSDYCKFEKSISKKIETLDVIPAKEASKLFENASFIMNLGIYVCSDKGGYKYQHNDPLITKIVKKTMESSWVSYSQKQFYRNGCVQVKPYCLNTAGVMGGSVCCTTYESQCNTALSKRESVFNGGGGGAQGGHFEFYTEVERKNFYDCYNHPFMKWQYSLWKCDNQNRLDKIPYFDYYDHAWDYEDFFNWFGLTPEERIRVMNEITQMQVEKES